MQTSKFSSTNLYLAREFVKLNSFFKLNGVYVHCLKLEYLMFFRKIIVKIHIVYNVYIVELIDTNLIIKVTVGLLEKSIVKFLTGLTKHNGVFVPIVLLQ